MKLSRTVKNQQDVLTLRESVLSSMKTAEYRFRSIDDLADLKFCRSMIDPITGKNTNFIEFLNMVFTYLVCIRAAEVLLEKYQYREFNLKLGTQGGYDVASSDGNIICECFAVTTASSNGKLRGDIKRLAANSDASEKYVIFYSYKDDSKLVEKWHAIYEDIAIIRLNMNELVGER